MLHCLGSNNPALEDLKLLGIDGSNVEATDNNSVLTWEQTQSLQCLLNGCRLLKDINLCNFKLSTSDIIYLVNHSIHLLRFGFGCCNICDNGLIITKEADKLKYLKQLQLDGNPNITDESIMNLVKGCQNLKVVNIEYCPKLTDASLFSIAANCPNLEFIYLTFDKVNITIVGLIQLLKKCPKLTTIISGAVPIPVEIKSQLQRRKLSMTSSLS